MSIKTISTREVYRNPWTSVREDIIERSNGVRGLYGVVDKDPASIIIALDQDPDHTPEGTFLYLVEQFRYTVGARFKEFPQGGWERPDIVPEALARGELQEETGLTAARMTLLGPLWIAYGVMRQKQYVYLAEGLTQGPTARDPEEHDLRLHRVSIPEFESLVLAGEIQDNCTLAAWGLYQIHRNKTPNL